MLSPDNLDAWSISHGVNEGQIDPIEVATYFANIVENDHRELNTHINWDKAAVLDSAEKQSDYIIAARQAKKPLALAGVPIIIKDNLIVKGELVTCGSRFLESYRGVYDATVIEKLKQAGAIFLGRSNMDEFAMGSSNENSSWGPVKNPINKNYVPGGSSGGSAAAVAAGMAPLALGTDTGGSIRQPASFCGVVGLKPSYGRVSRHGLVAFGSSFEQVGPIANNVRDAALLYDVISGHDRKDSTSSKRPIEPVHGLVDRWKDLKGLKIGIIEECFTCDVNEDVKTKVLQAIERMRQAGAEIKTLSIPSLKFAIPTYYLLAAAEASSNLSRFDGVRFGKRVNSKNLDDMYCKSRSKGFGKEVKQRILLGTFALSSGCYEAYYQKASMTRQIIRTEIQKVFKKGYVDLLVSPTSPTTAFQIGQQVNSLTSYLNDIFTVAANLAGNPAISLPCGFDSQGLPIGMQLMGPIFREDLIFRGAAIYEQST